MNRAVSGDPRAICVLAAAALLFLNACGSSAQPPSPGSPEPTAAPSPPPATTVAPPSSASAPATPPGPVGPGESGFQKNDEAEAKLVTANAYWRAPEALTVEHQQQIGLGIQSAPLTSQINTWIQNLPGTNQPAGQIKVSPSATARLEASDGAEVEPSGSQNQSTGSNIDLAFEWKVTPKRPTDDLSLTAYVEVHLEGISPPNDVITTPKTLHIRVLSTLPYKRGRIWSFISSNWPIWAPILGLPSLAAIGRWLFKKRGWIKRIRRKSQQADVAQSAGVSQARSTVRPAHSVEPEGEATRSRSIDSATELEAKNPDQ